ncbi:hypothetical protein G9464_16990 [Halostella sp. JP-L12]|uniref:hypothetical protein n=1 Tax=Halostella TaxID=1843185 RepID=UPI0013CE7F46|nr:MULTISPECIES: hypothetical protein [Halostella]NHN49271.1 hypothetical protein [Halostella sp. JP-L12]
METPEEFDYDFLETTREKEDYETLWTKGQINDDKGIRSFLQELDLEVGLKQEEGTPDTHN